MDKLYSELQEILEVDEVTSGQVLADFEAWDSLAALSLVAAVRSNFGVTLSGEDLRRAVTVGDIEKLVASRRSAEKSA